MRVLEKPDPVARSHSACTASQEGPILYYDSLLLATLAAAALAALFIAIQPAMARHGGSSHSFSGSSHSYSGGMPHFSRNFRSSSRGSSHTYAYRDHRHGRRHLRHERGGVFIYGYPYYDSYAYSDTCAWLHRRALATGSSYWWNRYYDCVEDND